MSLTSVSTSPQSIFVNKQVKLLLPESEIFVLWQLGLHVLYPLQFGLRNLLYPWLHPLVCIICSVKPLHKSQHQCSDSKKMVRWAVPLQQTTWLMSTDGSWSVALMVMMELGISLRLISFWHSSGTSGGEVSPTFFSSSLDLCQSQSRLSSYNRELESWEAPIPLGRVFCSRTAGLILTVW